MVQQRNPVFPFAVQCALLFLAVTVFGWSLQGKLAQYRAPAGHLSQATDHAKLTAEERSPHTQLPQFASLPPDLATEALRYAFLIAGHDAAPAAFSQPESGPRTPGRYNLHAPDGLHRPPPALA